MARLTDIEVEERLESNKAIYDEFYDPEFCHELISKALFIPMDYYFRIRKIGFEDEAMERNNPDAPVIVISNHSGMAFPWDGVHFIAYTCREKGFNADLAPRALVTPALSGFYLVNPFMIGKFWKKCGGIDATYLNFETMMHYPKANVFIYPEGIPGIGKGFDNRYQLQRFATSFVRMSLKYKTDVVPFVTVNGEWLNPYTYKWEWVNKLMQKVNLPMLPVGLHTPLLLFLPWMFYYAMPARMTYVRCSRVRPSDWVDKPYEELSDEEIAEVRTKIRASMQADMDKYVEEYGKKPYDWKDLFRTIKENFKYFPFMLPPFWPMLFTEFDRQWKRKKRAGKEIKIRFGFLGFLKMLILNPIVICYYIPVLGWIPLLIKGYRGDKA